jgi:glycosyltransferase involved in cell wall biosynthesis/O-antigen/teichoic acid export membrane protein
MARLPRLVRAWLAPGKLFYASTMAANAVGYVFFFVMARLLPVAEYGELVTLTALVFVFSVITRTMQAKAAQAVTALRSNDVPAVEAGATVLRQLVRPLASGTLLIMLVSVALSRPAASFLKLDWVMPMLILGAYVATHFLLSGPRGVLLGSGHLYYLSVVTLVDPLVRFAVALALVSRGGYDSGVLLAYVAGNVAATLVAVLPFLPTAVARLRRTLDQPSLRWLTYDRHFLFALFINGALMALPSIDPVAVRRFFSEEVAGTYAAAFLLGRIILLSTNAASWVVFSRAVQHHPQDRRTRRALARGLLLAGGFAGLVTLGYAVAPRLAAVALGGSAYQAAAKFVALVGVEMVVFSFVSVLAYYHVAVRTMRITVPFVLALGLEALLLAMFHATPYQVLFDTIFTLSALLVWLAVETALALRVRKTGSAAPQAMAPPRLCMVVHSHYPSDPRVRRETEAAVSAGWEVDVVCVPDEGEPPQDVINGVRVWRMPVRRNRFGGQARYLAEYGTFFAAASVRVALLHLRRPFQVVQVHNMPDFLVFIALLPKLLGARVVLDVHDLVPEFYSLRFGLPSGHGLVRLSRWVQRVSASFADHVLTAGEPFRRKLAANGVALGRITSIMNSPDPVLFAPRAPGARARPQAKQGLALSYHGTLTESNDLTVVLRALALLRDEAPGLVFNVYGRGRAVPALQALAAELGLQDQVRFHGYKPLDEIPSLIAAADVGLVPQRRSDFTALNYPTKAFEYIALGVPVLMTRTPSLEELFGHIDGTFFECDQPEQLAGLLRRLGKDSSAASRLAQEQQAVCASFAWALESQRYVDVLQRLRRQARQPAPEPVGA